MIVVFVSIFGYPVLQFLERKEYAASPGEMSYRPEHPQNTVISLLPMAFPGCANPS